MTQKILTMLKSGLLYVVVPTKHTIDQHLIKMFPLFELTHVIVSDTQSVISFKTDSSTYKFNLSWESKDNNFYKLTDITYEES